MSVRAIAWAWDQEGLSASQKLLLVALADNANDEGECWPGNRYLAQKCGMSVATLKRHKRTLIDRELVRIEEQKRSNGSQTSNVTRLTMGGLKMSRGVAQIDTPGGGTE